MFCNVLLVLGVARRFQTDPFSQLPLTPSPTTSSIGTSTIIISTTTFTTTTTSTTTTTTTTTKLVLLCTGLNVNVPKQSKSCCVQHRIEEGCEGFAVHKPGLLVRREIARGDVSGQSLCSFDSL